MWSVPLGYTVSEAIELISFRLQFVPPTLVTRNHNARVHHDSNRSLSGITPFVPDLLDRDQVGMGLAFIASPIRLMSESHRLSTEPS